jgi:hypothetical protein
VVEQVERVGEDLVAVEREVDVAIDDEVVALDVDVGRVGDRRGRGLGRRRPGDGLGRGRRRGRRFAGENDADDAEDR